MEKIEWKVDGMTCTNCALTINRYLDKQGLKDVKVNQTLMADYTAADRKWSIKSKAIKPLLQEVKTTEVIHHENSFNDFDRDRLLYHMLSTQGPGFAKASPPPDSASAPGVPFFWPVFRRCH